MSLSIRSAAGVLSIAVLLAAGALGNRSTCAADKGAGADPAKLKAARARGVEFLKTTQADDGSWTQASSPGIGGLVTAGLLRAGAKPEDPTVARALKYLSGYIQKDGGIYEPNTSHKNYETSICLLAFHAANTDGKYDQVIANARDFLKKLQWDEGEDTKPDDLKFGGAG